jgi:phosphate-selective porin
MRQLSRLFYGLPALSAAFAQGVAPGGDNAARLDWSAYVQTRYTGIENDEDMYALRRLKLMLGGSFSGTLDWYVQGIYKDGNRADNDGRVYFQEGWLRISRSKRARLTLGQFKPPFGLERFTPDFKILTIDRSQATDALSPNGRFVDSFYRDRGVQLDGVGRGGTLNYAVGVFDGQGANHQFHGIGPLVSSRVFHEAALGRKFRGRTFRLHVGGSVAARRARSLGWRPCCSDPRWSTLRHFTGSDTHAGAEFFAEWGDLSLRAEYLRTHYRFRPQTSPDYSSAGFYVQAAKTLAPKWQVVVKIEKFDPNRTVDGPKDNLWTTVGVNHYIRGDYLKLMANYVHRGERRPAIHNSIVQVQMQCFLK